MKKIINLIWILLIIPITLAYQGNAGDYNITISGVSYGSYTGNTSLHNISFSLVNEVVETTTVGDYNLTIGFYYYYPAEAEAVEEEPEDGGGESSDFPIEEEIPLELLSIFPFLEGASMGDMKWYIAFIILAVLIFVYAIYKKKINAGISEGKELVFELDEERKENGLENTYNKIKKNVKNRFKNFGL